MDHCQDEPMTPTKAQDPQVRLTVRLAECGDFSDQRLQRAISRALHRSHRHRKRDEARLSHARKLWVGIPLSRRLDLIVRSRPTRTALDGRLQRHEDGLVLCLVPFVMRFAQGIVSSPHSVMRLVHVGLVALGEAVLHAHGGEQPSVDRDILDVVVFSMFDAMSPRPLPRNRSWRSLEAGARHRLRPHLERARLVGGGGLSPDQWFFLDGALTRALPERPFPTTRLTEPVYPVRLGGSGRAALAAVLRVWDTPRPMPRHQTPRDLGISSDPGPLAR